MRVDASPAPRSPRRWRAPLVVLATLGIVASAQVASAHRAVRDDASFGALDGPAGGAPVVPDAVVPRIDAAMKERLAALLAQSRGRGDGGVRLDAFSKVGDSISAAQSYMFTLGNVNDAWVNLGAYKDELAPIVKYFRARSVDATGRNSFQHPSFAAWPGWTSADVMDPRFNTPAFWAAPNFGTCFAPFEPMAACRMRRLKPKVCPAGDSLTCDVLATKAFVALIMIGTNDTFWLREPSAYRANLEAIVRRTLALGVIPVVSTLPDRFGDDAFGEPMATKVLAFNAVVRDVAQAMDVPLWDLWQALTRLPNKGLAGDVATGRGDLTHLGVCPQGDAVLTPECLRFGANMRHLTALRVLDKVTSIVALARREPDR
jgi:hypothetical protein